jgi:hypothetical protein
MMFRANIWIKGSERAAFPPVQVVVPDFDGQVKSSGRCVPIKCWD